MNVVYDLLGFQSRDHGERGIARYVLNLALALERNSPGLVTEWLVHPDLPFPAGAEALLATGRVRRTDQPSSHRLPSAGGIFIAGSPFESFNFTSDHVLPSFARTPAWRSIAVIHDLIPAIFPELYLQDPDNDKYYRARFTGLHGFDRFLTNSQATTDDAVEMLGIDESHFTMIGAGADGRFQPPLEGHTLAEASLVADRAIPGLRAGFILFPTGIDPRKNIERAIHAYGRLPEHLRRRHQLVLSCRLSESDSEIVDTMAAEAGVKGELIATGYTSDDLLCRLYQAAHLVLFPSYYEGFGLPALEAMHCGAPVICADATSLREVQPLTEARFDPMSIDSIADALHGALTDRDLRDRLRAQQLPSFTWDLAAERTAKVVRELSTRVRERVGRRPRRPRLAVFTPLPPQLTPDAAYGYRLVEALCELCDVTAFVDGDPHFIEGPPGVRIEPSAGFPLSVTSGAAFDANLYVLGNGRYHIGALRTLERHPGSVLFLAPRLTELYGERLRMTPDQLPDESVGQLLSEMYPGRYRAEVEQMASISAETADRFGILMAKEAAHRAEHVFVHSQYAASLVKLDSGIGANVVTAQPCPLPDSSAADRSRNGAKAVVVAGVVEPAAQPEKIIAALAQPKLDLETVWLRFVGPGSDGYLTKLKGLAAELGIAERVTFEGQLSRVDEREAMRSATAAVVLPATTDGSTPAAVVELLSLGVPCIVSAFGPLAELPDRAVVGVEPTIAPDELGRLIASLLGDPDRLSMVADQAASHVEATSFAATAAQLLAHLISYEPTPEATMNDEQFAQLRASQGHLQAQIDELSRGQSTYLGNNLVLTWLFTGQKVYVDTRDVSVAPALIMNGSWEPNVTDAFLRLVKPTDCVIDVGANMGYFGLIAGTAVDPQQGGSLHMIEANPRLVSLLTKSLNVNGLIGHSTVTNCAISNQAEQLELRLVEDLWGSSFIAEPGEPTSESIEDVVTVDAISLDQFAESHGLDHVDLVKLDIEGIEDRAYAGMADVIERNRDNLTLLLEFSPGRYRDPSLFFDRIAADFKYIYGIEEHPGGTVVETLSYKDVEAMATVGFVMLVARNSEMP